MSVVVWILGKIVFPELKIPTATTTTAMIAAEKHKQTEKKPEHEI
jgi:hypothetical protein